MVLRSRGRGLYLQAHLESHHLPQGRTHRLDGEVHLRLQTLRGNDLQRHQHFFEQHQPGVVARLSNKNRVPESETDGNQDLEMMNNNYLQDGERAR